MNSEDGANTNLTLKSTMEYGITGAVSKKPIVEYILDVTSEVNGKKVKGKGTIELLVV